MAGGPIGGVGGIGRPTAPPPAATVDEAPGAFAFSGTHSAQAGGTEHDYDPGNAVVLRFTPFFFGGSTITGFAGGTPGRILIIQKAPGTPSETVTLANENAGSQAENRIMAPTGTNVVLSNADQVGHTVFLIYDGAASRWRMLNFLAGSRLPHVADPAGGTVVDAEARAAINAILLTLETFRFHADA